MSTDSWATEENLKNAALERHYAPRGEKWETSKWEDFMEFLRVKEEQLGITWSDELEPYDTHLRGKTKPWRR